MCIKRRLNSISTGLARHGSRRRAVLPPANRHVTDFTNKSLRGLVAGLLDQDYSMSKMSYRLRRLRLHGLIHRLPHSNTYALTGEGIRVAIFYTELQNRLLRPLLEADEPPANIEIRRALKILESAVSAVSDHVQNARLTPTT